MTRESGRPIVKSFDEVELGEIRSWVVRAIDAFGDCDTDYGIAILWRVLDDLASEEAS
jgi:hypothetical protein